MAKAHSRTTKGTLVWPHLHAPDTKFNTDGIYSTKFTLDPVAGAKLAAEIDNAILASVATAKKDEKNKGKKIKQADAPYTQNEETGEYTFNFKLNAKGTKRDGTKFTQQPALFDARNQKIPAGVRIGGGSTGIIAYEIAEFFTALVGAGVTLRLKAVQITNLVQFGGNAASFGFAAEDDGFDASGLEPEEAESTANAVESESPAPAGQAPQSGADF